MRLLKQSTAVDLAIGPFLDSTDGVTAETALTVSQADVRLKKNGGNWAQKNDANAATHEENGWYEVPLNATDTNTLGVLVLAVHESGALPVWHEFMVVPANVYDALVAGSDNLQVHAVELANNLITAAAIAAGALTQGKFGSSFITSSSFATGAINAAAVAADAIGASEFAQGAADKVWASAARALTDKADFALSAAAVAAIWDEAMEGTHTARHYMRGIASASFAKVAGAATTTVTIRDVDDSKDRITATVDADGNRTALTLDLT